MEAILFRRIFLNLSAASIARAPDNKRCAGQITSVNQSGDNHDAHGADVEPVAALRFAAEVVLGDYEVLNAVAVAVVRLLCDVEHDANKFGRRRSGIAPMTVGRSQAPTAVGGASEK